MTQTNAEGITVKRDAPTMDGTSIEAVLYCLREFNEISEELNYNTGQELFHNFRRVLKGAAKEDWDVIIAGIAHHTQAIFRTWLNSWKAGMILPTARQTLVDYLEVLTKPRAMTVESFVNRLKVMIRYM